MLTPFFKARTDLARSQGIQEGRRVEREERSRRYDEIKRLEVERMVGAPVIVVPNEWANPVIGFGVSVMTVGRSSLLVIRDYLAMEEVWCGGVQMDFSEQRLEVALSLDPFQLWAITAHNSVDHHDFEKAKTGERWERQRILDTLHANGFFERWNEFRQSLDSDSP